MKRFSLTLAKCAAFVIAALAAACSGAGLPGPTNPGMPNGPTPTPGPVGPPPPFALTVPSGFQVSMVSNNVPGARFMAFAPNGDLLVSETSAGNVVALKPGSPVNANPTVVASNLNVPHGLAFHNSDLYIATLTGLSVVRNYPGGTVQTFWTGLPTVGDHNHRPLAIAADGSFYESSGSDCNLCTPAPNTATVVHIAADGSSATTYATGVRNGSGLAFDNGGQLWMTVNQRDELPPNHENLPTDEFDKVVSNGDYGWPQCYPDLAGARQPNPDYNGGGSSCAGQQTNTFPLQAHSAPLGIVFYYGTMFPSTYSGGAFVAFHGSWNRTVPTGDKVVFVSFSNGQPKQVSDFVTGWMLPDGSYQGRPVGLAIGPDGSLYISDDKLGYVYRVTHT
jgi:glucose/arabinose dehydrogenase